MTEESKARTGAARPPGFFNAPLVVAWTGYGLALLAVAGMSVLVGLASGRLPSLNFLVLYLIPVLALAVAFGRGPAILASVVSVLVFNWFFVSPLHAFVIADPNEWIALGLFLLTAVTAGQLAAGQRLRAEEAERRAHDTAALYDVGRLLNEVGLEQGLEAIAERLRQNLSLAAVGIALVDGGDGELRAAVGDTSLLPEALRVGGAPFHLLISGQAPGSVQPGAAGRWVRVVPPRLPGGLRSSGRSQVVPIKVHDGVVGQVFLVQEAGAAPLVPGDNRVVGAVATQIGAAADRLRLRREATETEILRRADELKSALLHAVSHDLRTPLASIVASAGSLRQPDVGWSEEERREIAATIEEQALRLNRIVGNLLDLSRLQAGSLVPERGWYDLGALLDDVVGRLKPLAADHAVRVVTPDDLPPVLMDYVEIDQVLSNLLENAIKYSPAGSEIEVSARLGGGEVLVEVADRGPGLTPGALANAFEPFYRAEHPDPGGPRPKGTGLGLAVARGLVEAHGGRIWAANREGGGARFAFALPLAEAKAARAPREEDTR
ncbi:MAG: ATP-binding protein [Chloroflexota bacterium]